MADSRKRQARVAFVVAPSPSPPPRHARVKQSPRSAPPPPPSPPAAAADDFEESVESLPLRDKGRLLSRLLLACPSFEKHGEELILKILRSDRKAESELTEALERRELIEQEEADDEADEEFEYEDIYYIDYDDGEHSDNMDECLSERMRYPFSGLFEGRKVMVQGFDDSLFLIRDTERLTRRKLCSQDRSLSMVMGRIRKSWTL
jgi:hypothetical protein